MTGSPYWHTQPPNGPWQGGGSGPRDWSQPLHGHDRWDDRLRHAMRDWDPGRIGRVPLIIAMVLGFILFWPIGLLILGYLWWSGQMGCRRRHAMAGGPAPAEWDRDSGRVAPPWAGWFRGRPRPEAAPPSSGNHAFDEYRAETLRRLEEEQKEFAAYLERLRFAKDKAEFDQFMAERRQRPATPPAPEAP